MDGLKLAENIVRLRNDRKMTQEQLAEFIGVTKASVSKWETGKSLPDIVILPRLAAFFDITVDELIGYVPQLSKEQIEKLYQELAGEFAVLPFEEVMAKTQAYVKQYYSCYPFLFRICVLWLNHYILAEGEKRKVEILNSISQLCEHIKANCRNISISDDVVVLQAMVLLQLGRAAEVVEMLEEVSKPFRLWGKSGTILAQAYRMEGKTDKAESYIQINMYNAIMSLVSIAIEYLSAEADRLPVCEQTIERIGQVETIYEISKLNPNLIAVFEYQAAFCFAMHGEKEKALAHIEKYVSCLQELFAHEEILLHGDAYFDKIEDWFYEIGASTPRNRKTILDDIKKSFVNPVFQILEGEQKFKKIKKQLDAIF